MYAICCGTARRMVPTFYLDGDVQGIVSTDHAERIARDIVPDALYITVLPLQSGCYGCDNGKCSHSTHND